MLGEKAKRVRGKLHALRHSKRSWRLSRDGGHRTAPDAHRTSKPASAQATNAKRAKPYAPKGVAEAALAIASACGAVVAGFEPCVRRTRDVKIAVAARNAAGSLKALQEATIAADDALGVDARPRARTCDRLRWEWLASTATVVDGSADARLLSGCARILSEVVAATRSTNALGPEIPARLRLAPAEACSLSLAVVHERRQELALALG
jgi:hypothetical protein